MERYEVRIYPSAVQDLSEVIDYLNIDRGTGSLAYTG